MTGAPKQSPSSIVTSPAEIPTRIASASSWFARLQIDRTLRRSTGGDSRRFRTTDSLIGWNSRLAAPTKHPNDEQRRTGNQTSLRGKRHFNFLAATSRSSFVPSRLDTALSNYYSEHSDRG